MIARIMGEGQWTLTAPDIDALDALDDELSVAVETHDEEGFRYALGALLAEVRRRGTPLPDDAEEPSELILPSSDASLDEVRVMLSESGLIPG
ncbi:hypothetical protein OG292_17445 [Streptomyces sp. NBC_01511]|uniref:PspA-associated protein PspAA n=1 Tax=Streptomyces sp. NBC_01511 TaxID=2903889 RepID=UPI00386E25E1